MVNKNFDKFEQELSKEFREAIRKIISGQAEQYDYVAVGRVAGLGFEELAEALPKEGVSLEDRAKDMRDCCGHSVQRVYPTMYRYQGGRGEKSAKALTIRGIELPY